MAQVPVQPQLDEVQAALNPPVPPAPPAQEPAANANPADQAAAQPAQGEQNPAPQAGIQAPGEDVQALQQELRDLKESMKKSGVESVLDMVRQLASRPAPLVDPYALIAALGQLADVARESNHAEKKRFEAIFKQCRNMAREPRLASVVIQLLGDQEQRQVAGQIHKLLKSFPRPVPSPGPSGLFRPGPYPPSRPSRNGRANMRQRCFLCKKFGHFARNCDSKQ